MKRLENKIAIVTGGNSGIGKSIAQKFINEGARVVILGRNEETLQSSKDELGANLFTFQGDVTNTNDIQNLLKYTNEKLGKIDVLVVNSGIGERLHIKDVTEEKFDKLVNVNYKGAYFTVKYALPYFNKDASIIFISSIAAHATLINHSVYASSKAAVLKLTRNLSFDLGEAGIRVNSISPGYIETPIFTERLKKDPDYLNRRTKLIPLSRIGKPEDVANAALFLASDEASYITGADIIVDGGYTCAFHEE